MDLQFSDNTDKEKFNQFVQQTEPSDIFQDTKWADVSATKGWNQHKILTLSQQEEIVIGALGYILHSKFFGSYLYIQHGPIIDNQFINTREFNANNWGEIDLTVEGKQIFAQFVDQLKAYCKQKGYFLLVIEPLATESGAVAEILKNTNFQNQKWAILPKYPMFMDLTKSEEELLTEMDKNTRYNIRYAQRQGVEIEFLYPKHENLEQITTTVNKLYQLLQSNSEDKGYSLTNSNFFIEAINQYKNTDNLLIAVAKYQGEIISANFTQLFGSWAGSYYIANSREFPKLRASYLLKWATIMEAKNKGKKVFDMWGQIPGLSKNNPEYGYGQFKRSFNPVHKTFIGRAIYPINSPKFIMWKIIGRLRYNLSH